MPFIFITDGERISFTAEEVASPRLPKESQEEAEGIVKSTYLLQLSCNQSVVKISLIPLVMVTFGVNILLQMMKVFPLLLKICHHPGNQRRVKKILTVLHKCYSYL